MAALLHIVNPPPELREKYERVNIGGTATVVEAAIKAGVKRVVLFSETFAQHMFLSLRGGNSRRSNLISHHDQRDCHGA